MMLVLEKINWKGLVITLDKPWQSRQQVLSNWVNMAANFILKCIHQMCVVIPDDTSCYMLRCRPEILSRTAPCIQSSFTKRILNLFKTERMSSEGCMSCAFVHACVNLHAWPCMYVCMCVWRSHIPTAGMPRPLLRMWRILSSKKGVSLSLLFLFNFCSGINIGQPWVWIPVSMCETCI